jgi:hypothetical protein
MVCIDLNRGAHQGARFLNVAYSDASDLNCLSRTTCDFQRIPAKYFPCPATDYA